MTKVRAAPLELATLDALDVDAWAVFVAEDERPLFGLAGLLDWKLTGRLTKLIRDGSLAGSAGETLLTASSHGLKGSRIFAFGLGKSEKTAFSQRASEAIAALVKAGVKRVAIGVPEKPSGEEAARSIVEAVRASALDEAIIVGPAEAARALPKG